MKRKQIAKLGLTLGLVGAVGVGGTLAALTAQSKEVKNTFAVGKNLTANDLILDEYDLQDDNRTADKSKPRVQKLNFQNLMQGDGLDKDPTVQIKKEGTAECYMFVKVTGLDALNAQGITVNWDGTHWKKYSDSEKLDGYYYYIDDKNSSVIDPSKLTSDDIKPGDGFYELESLFTKVTVRDNAELYKEDPEQEGEYKAVDLADIVVQACAVQAQNVDNIQAAYSKLPEGFTSGGSTATE
ncbi:MAG TPA: SipW-dependent-type signal peptide-containing protein [Candidatus Blautia merdavium]|uniref:SipW-dependent-type signal peptide-containing protein n=1 Tax=Candidatus Blautia merdavium TaxID=2838494 RepID=A0A9D2PQ60_9FIRM|nr:SipW-dependent-type signal peptide-containing protein [Candidatus Blautia merdavium]